MTDMTPSSQSMFREQGDNDNVCSVRPVYSEELVQVHFDDADKISDLKARITDKLGIAEKYQALTSGSSASILSDDMSVCDVQQPIVMRATVAGGASCGVVTTIPELLQCRLLESSCSPLQSNLDLL
jgi:hypothetical protein